MGCVARYKVQQLRRAAMSWLPLWVVLPSQQLAVEREQHHCMGKQLCPHAVPTISPGWYTYRARYRLFP